MICMIGEDEYDAGASPVTQLIHHAYHASAANPFYPVILILKKACLGLEDALLICTLNRHINLFKIITC